MFGLAFAMAGAQEGTTGGADGGMAAFQQFIPLIFMFAIFYFLLIRPQKKKALEHKALLESIKRGTTSSLPVVSMARFSRLKMILSSSMLQTTSILQSTRASLQQSSRPSFRFRRTV
jgi:hypothetical protein